MLEQQLGEVDPSRRRELLRRIIRYINTEMVWGQAIFYPPSALFWHPYVRGMYPHFYGQNGLPFDLTQAWVVK